MDSKQRAKLKSLANQLDTIIQVGKNGVNEEIIKVVNNAFNNREIIKLRVINVSPISAWEAATVIAEKTGSQVVQVIGTRFVLYKKLCKNTEKKRKKLTDKSKAIEDIESKIIRRGYNRGKKRNIDKYKMGDKKSLLRQRGTKAVRRSRDANKHNS